ncbi:hypothetical protein Dimus_036628, partial [Dionaea muscipula]
CLLGSALSHVEDACRRLGSRLWSRSGLPATSMGWSAAVSPWIRCRRVWWRRCCLVMRLWLSNSARWWVREPQAGRLVAVWVGGALLERLCKKELVVDVPGHIVEPSRSAFVRPDVEVGDERAEGRCPIVYGELGLRRAVAQVVVGGLGVGCVDDASGSCDGGNPSLAGGGVGLPTLGSKVAGHGGCRRHLGVVGDASGSHGAPGFQSFASVVGSDMRFDVEIPFFLCVWLMGGLAS